MNAWRTGDTGDVDAMGPTVTREVSANTPPLKNGGDLRESGYLIAVGSRTARFRRKHKNKLVYVALIVILLMLFTLAVAMTALYVHQKRNKPIPICESKECLRSAANLALSMDRTVDPCTDFYEYSCGNWAKDHPQPDAQRPNDWFRDKQTKVYIAVRDFLEKNSTNHPKPVQQAKDIYKACMDTETLNKRGIRPVIEILNALGLPSFPTLINITDDIDYNNYTFDWLETVIKIKTQLGMDVLIGFDIYSDPKNSSVYRLMLGSPETTNPFPSMHNEKKRHTGKKTMKHANIPILKTILTHKRSFFIFKKKYEYDSKATNDNDDERIAQIYKLFYAQLIKLFILESENGKDLKLPEADLDQQLLKTADAYYNFNENIYELEATNDTDVEDDFDFNLPEFTVDEIQAHTDMIVENNDGTSMAIWKRYLQGVFNNSNVELNFETDKVIVSEFDLRYMSLMAAYLSKTSPVVIELYIWIKVTEVLAVHTTTEIRELFDKSNAELHYDNGVSSSTPRSLICASAVNDMLGMAVAYAIVDPNFMNVTKPKIESMLNELKNALAHLVGKTKWMDDNTKLETYKKIIQMKTLIGFPEWLIDEKSLELYYEGIEVDAEKHLENMINVIQVKVRNALNNFREIHNYSWATDPTEVNAYHTFQSNTITIPLVMLQYPFFELGLESLNYGALGTILGHEITHGFDNFGRLFDKNGNLVPWWSNETTQLYVNMTQCFVQQYSSFYFTDLDEYVNGRTTLGENIADNGGVRESLAALKRHLHKYGPEPKLPGFEHMTSEQMFFLSYGNLWCGVSTKESSKKDLEDEHSPQRFRAIGTLQNSEDFARAWNCPPGSPMNPQERCIIF
ncbi:unnamed protein product [Parnassius mnemosyne]|uniref:Endothelin-converting enzyme 1 n=1 Tax=Parnassius mnemosyne TaxID=213953 RepID=A0AAV1KMD6_9NEOP